MACGCTIGKEMGINTWFALCGSEEAASCSGDFLTFAGELQPVLKALRAHGINVVTIHNHMEGEDPQSVFLHFWGKGRAESLAAGFKAALEAQKCMSAAARAGPPFAQIMNFDDGATGSLPSHWKAEGTNQIGPTAAWEVTKDAAAPSAPNVLTLTSVNHDSSATFNICWNDAVRFQDGSIEVKFRANSGKNDQGGGIIWRATNADNYYLARMNPLEDNLRLYTVKGGTRKQLASATVKAASGLWHTIRIEHHGGAITCSLNGEVLIDATDTTFAKAGGVGVWTKADAATSFDDFLITPAAAASPR
jgi:hypothetical protein